MSIHQPRRQMDKSDEKKIVEWYVEDEMSVEQISKRLRSRNVILGNAGISRVSNVLREHGVTLRYRVKAKGDGA